MDEAGDTEIEAVEEKVIGAESGTAVVIEDKLDDRDLPASLQKEGQEFDQEKKHNNLPPSLQEQLERLSCLDPLAVVQSHLVLVECCDSLKILKTFEKY